MGVSDYVLNVMSAVVAMEYIDYGFRKKYCGIRRWRCFIIGCAVYFLMGTVLKQVAETEGVLCFFYGVVLIGYGIWALEGKIQDFLVTGFFWVLITMIGTYAVFEVMGLLTGNSLEEMLTMEECSRLYASFVALAVKFSMGKIATVLFRGRAGFHEKESWIVAGAFVFMTLLALGLFWLEAGELERPARDCLAIGIVIDEVGIFALLVQMYHCLGKCRKEKLEEQYRREREQEQLEGLMDMYRVSREINHWRHDMLAELGVLYRMQKNGKYTEVEAYLEKLCSGLRDYPELPQSTGNEGLDAALMKIIFKCREKGIRFCYVVLGKPERMDSVVLGNLLDNLLSNGMEACQNLVGTREMELVVREQGEGLEICLENSIGESVLENNPKFVSHKQDRERHGFGMESICRIVEEYDGSYEYWEEKKEEESKFCQRICLRYS